MTQKKVIYEESLIYKRVDFRYMKFIYLHCGEEMKLRDPRS